MDFSQYKQLEFRRKFFKLFGASIRISDPASSKLVGFIQMKAWVLKEDVRLYSDDTKSVELLRIHARSIIDFGTTYDVVDSATGQPLFNLRRKGLKSAFVRDHWDIMTTDDQPLGALQETSQGLALVRRYVALIPIIGEIIDIVLSFTPLTYQILDAGGNVAAEVTHRKNPFIVKFGLDTSTAKATLDPRVNIAAVSMLAVVDASKN
jgi:hypothetical protein